MSSLGDAIPAAVGLVVGVTFIMIFAWFFHNLASESIGDRIAMPSQHEISIVTIPQDASFPGNNFEPEIIKVIIGINNTVRWLNQDTIPYSVVSDSDYVDPKSGPFDVQARSQEKGGAFIMPGKSYEFTFTRTGIFGYHSVPHPQLKGTVVVLAQGVVDNVTQSLVEERLRQKIEWMPLAIYVGDRISDGSLPVRAVQGFVLDKPANVITAYLVHPGWLITDDSQARTNRTAILSTTKATLTDRVGNSVPFKYASNSTILMVDAICPFNNMTIREDGFISGVETSKETKVSYGPLVTLNITGYSKDSSARSILYLNYSLGQVKPLENIGIYRLTFVTPYEASIKISENLLPGSSIEYSNCGIIAASKADQAREGLSYYEIILDLRNREASEPSSR